MVNHNKVSRIKDAGVLVILFAVSLGEGFIAGMFQYQDMIISGAVLTWGDPGQGMYRIVLSFLIILLSWLYFRAHTMDNPDYPSGEFIMDVIVVMTYMSLFLFVDAPVQFCFVVMLIWVWYALARHFSNVGGLRTKLTGLVFIAAFAAVAYSTYQWSGDVAEWSRLLVLTILVVLYRPLILRFERLETQNSNDNARSTG